MATIVQDNFNRADSTNNLGTSSSGHLWRVDQGTFGINSSFAYMSTNTYNSFATVDAGVSECKVEIDVPSYTGGGTLELALYLNYKDKQNHYVLSVNAWTLSLDKKVNDTITNLYIEFDGYAITGKKIGIERVGNQIKVYFNNILQGTVTDTTFISEKRHGFGCVEGGTSVLFDNFLITGTPPPTTTNLKRYDGAVFQGVPLANIKRYNGATFSAVTGLKRWNGSSWVDI